MNRTSFLTALGIVLALAGVACQSIDSAHIGRRAPATSERSGLEEVTILARGME